MQYGFVKVASAVPQVRLAAPQANAREMFALCQRAAQEGAEFIVFPELSLTGYTCTDLFEQTVLLDEAERSLGWLLRELEQMPSLVCLLGMPLRTSQGLINAAVVTQGGAVLGVVPKTFLPNYKEFQEQRWFVSAEGRDFGTVTLAGQRDVPVGQRVFRSERVCFGVEICEDLWSPLPPSIELVRQGAHLIFNLSASDELVGKHAYLRDLVKGQSARCLCGYVYASCGWGESSQDLLFGGNALIAENGRMLAEGARFSRESQVVCTEIDVDFLASERLRNTTFTDVATRAVAPIAFSLPAATADSACPVALTRRVDPFPFVPQGPALDERCEEIFSIQSMALARRVEHTHARKLVIGISGGLDSTLALLVAARTCDLLQRPRTDILGITMPGFGTTGRTHDNALALMDSLGAERREVSIVDAVMQHFSDIGHDPKVHDVTYENSQARERTQILFDVANQTGGLLVGTGDLSELALGWATYNGDHMSSYGVNASVPKTLVRHLVLWVAKHSDSPDVRRTLLDVADTPVSPELLPADKDGHITQKTEDLVGPYELHDFFLYHFLRNGFAPAKILYLARHAFAGSYTDDVIAHWLDVFCRRFFAQQFKRSCLPDGPKVGSVSLSPRGDWRMPTDAHSDIWRNDLAAATAQ